MKEKNEIIMPTSAGIITTYKCTAECVKKNGIDVKTGAKLESKGEVSSIYQNDKKEYAVLLDCEQNGTKTRVLLLVKVKGNKIAEMTYNSVKQEY